MLNLCVFEGNLVKDPELRRTNTGTTTTTFTIAVDNSVNKNEQTLFLPVTIFGAQADNVYKWFRKGSPIIVTGRLVRSTFQSRESVGEKKDYYNLVANTFDFPTKGKGGQADQIPQKQVAPIKASEPQVTGNNLSDIDISDDDLPF